MKKEFKTYKITNLIFNCETIIKILQIFKSGLKTKKYRIWTNHNYLKTIKFNKTFNLKEFKSKMKKTKPIKILITNFWKISKIWKCSKRLSNKINKTNYLTLKEIYYLWSLKYQMHHNKISCFSQEVIINIMLSHLNKQKYNWNQEIICRIYNKNSTINNSKENSTIN